MNHSVIALLAVALLAALHLFSYRLELLEGIPRSRWLSIAGGVSVAYVFIHLLPELGRSQQRIERELGSTLSFMEHHAYLMALLGLIFFYGLESHARRVRGKEKSDSRVVASVFWLHMASFALYNGIIGYLLLSGESRVHYTLILYTTAMALHFLVTDHALRTQNRELYQRWGRWILVIGVVGGALLGMATALHALLVTGLTAFLAGGIVLNVLKEELPEERESRFTAFLFGSLAYAAVLLAV